jgi:hypothetical protein
MGASAGGGAPVLTDTLTAQVGVILQNPTAGSGGVALYAANQFASGGNKASSKRQTFSLVQDSSLSNPTNNESWQPLTISGGPSLSIAAPKSVNSNTPNMDVAYNSSIGYATIYTDGTTTAKVSFINGTNSAISATVSYNYGSTISVVRGCAVGSQFLVAVFMSVAGVSTQLIPADNTQFYSAVAGPGDYSNRGQMVSLTNTLGVLIYNAAGSAVKLATWNISGTTITYDAAVSASLSTASGAKLVVLDATHVLMVYRKTTNTLAARVVTVATGSTFTFNTEYTCTATGITTDPIGAPDAIGSDYGVTYINGNGQGCVVLMSVSGTAITFSNPSIFDSCNSMYGINDFNSYFTQYLGNGNQATISYLYYSKLIGATQFPLVKEVTMDLNFDKTTNLWNTTYSGNIQLSQGLSITANANIDEVSLGTDRTFVAGCDNSTSTMRLFTKELTYDQAYNNYATTFSGAGAVNAVAVSNIGFASNANTSQRTLVTYGFNGNSLRAFVCSNDVDGTITTNAETVIEAATITCSPYTVNCTNFDQDKTLVLFNKSNGVYARIITTSGTTVTSIGSATQIYSQTLSPTAFCGTCLLDSTHVAVIINVYGVNATYKMLILDLSAGTITPGVVIDVGTNISGISSNADICQLAAGRGLVTYADNVSGSNDYQVQTFTWSGTTITLGASVFAITTGGGASTSDQTNQTRCMALNTTEALFAAHGVNNTYVITSSAQNTVSVGTGYAISSGQYAIIKPDSYSKVTCRAWNGSTYKYAMANRV